MSISLEELWLSNDTFLVEVQLDNCSFNDTRSDPVYDFLERYYTIVIVVLGILGNCLSAVVFMRTSLRSRTSSYYLTALAISDTGFLLVLAYNYLAPHVFTSLSTWIIVCFTVERFVAVQYPLHRHHVCTLHRTKYVILFTVLLALGVNVIPLFAVGINECAQCDVLPGYDNVYSVFTMVDTVGSLLIPAVLIVVMNTLIAIRLTKFSRYYHLRQFQLREMNRPGTNNKSSVSFSTLTSSNTHDGHVIKEAGVDNTLTGLNMPSYLIRLYDMWSECVPQFMAQLQPYTMLLFYTNFAINIFLYSTCGVSFRRAMFKLGRRRIRARCAPYRVCRVRFNSVARSMTI